MSVILVNPEGTGSWQGDVGAKNNQYMFPYSIVYLHNYLLKHNVESRIFDLYQDDPQAAIEYCAKFDRPIVGVTSQSYSRYEAIDFIRRVKKVVPGAIGVVGGNHFGFCAEETLRHIEEIDVVVRGEGEVTFFELVRSLAGNGDLSSVDGISYRRDGVAVSNADRRPAGDIEEFAIDFEQLPTNNFKRGIFMRNFQNEEVRSLPVHFARGCTMRCIFCSFGLTAYRIRKVERVVDEMLYLKDKFDNRFFTICDPSFTARRQFVKDFCERLIKEDADIKWYCEARVDTPLDLLELMARAGCMSLDFAIESGSERVLRAIKKNINIPQAMDFAAECKKLGIRTLVFFMVSLPDETERDAMETMRIADKMSEYTKYVTLNVAQVLPGTELERIARERNIVPKDFSWYDQRFNHSYPDLGPENMPLYVEHLSVDFIRKFQKEFHALTDTKFTTVPDLIRMMKKGMRRIPNQPIGKTVYDVKTFGGRVLNKISG